MRLRARAGIVAALSVLVSGIVAIQPAAATDTVAEPSTQTVVSSFPAGTIRLAGADRYATAIAASKKFEADVPVAFVATGSAFPDALSASSAAALLGGPLLLTPPTALPAAVSQEIARLKPAKLVVVGGTGAVSAQVAAELGKLAPTTRVGGGDRYATSLAIVDNSFSSASHAIIATGSAFPDALAATGAAGSRQAPVVLVDGSKPNVSPATLSTLKKLGVTSVAIAGGTGAVSAGIQQQLAGSFAVARHGGSDRYETAALFNRAYFATGSSATMFLATGATFPDALAGAALAGALSAPMYITTAKCVPEVIQKEIAALGASTKVVMGGTAVVSDAAAANTVCAKAPVVTNPTPQPPTVGGTVTAGAFCAKEYAGRIGYTSTGQKMKCMTSSTDSRLRWRAV